VTESTGKVKVGFWSPKCMWPNQIDATEVTLCDNAADYFVNGFSYCEDHVKEFVMDAVNFHEQQAATPEMPYYELKTDEQLQDDIDSSLNGEWSYHGGQDE
jgi:hypothetical protein